MGATEQDANLALFSNVRSACLWSGTEYAPEPNLAWYFNSTAGIQSHFIKEDEVFAVAVRPGDVAAVPEPQTHAMVLPGLGAVLLAVKRRRH